jgi:hypothetical protein
MKLKSFMFVETASEDVAALLDSGVRRNDVGLLHL